MCAQASGLQPFVRSPGNMPVLSAVHRTPCQETHKPCDTILTSMAVATSKGLGQARDKGRRTQTWPDNNGLQDWTWPMGSLECAGSATTAASHDKSHCRAVCSSQPHSLVHVRQGVHGVQLTMQQMGGNAMGALRFASCQLAAPGSAHEMTANGVWLSQPPSSLVYTDKEGARGARVVSPECARGPPLTMEFRCRSLSAWCCASSR
jgi:hypothetical protein